MGLFDRVRSEWPVPGGVRPDDLQTKSLACTMDEFTLSASGRLLRADGSDTGFHGVLRLHGLTADGRFQGLEAKFTDGQLQHLVPEDLAHYGEDGLLRPPASPDNHTPP